MEHCIHLNHETIESDFIFLGKKIKISEPFLSILGCNKSKSCGKGRLYSSMVRMPEMKIFRRSGLES